MFLNLLCFLSLHISFVMMYVYETPLAETLFSGKCKKNSHVLNDCNWCYCNERSQYICSPRLCQHVDMFQHFKENIQELHLGMEGHGTWRSSLDKSCEPGMRYTKGNVTCICSSSGTWPNAACDNLFQVLYQIEITGVAHPDPKMTCNYTELYLVGCNACFCPKTGHIDPELCTKKTCEDGDPALAANKGQVTPSRRSFTVPFKSLYATCTTNQQYKIGCRLCTCKANNNLVCGDCKNDTKLKKSNKVCFGHRKYTFVDDCNICYCGVDDFAMCTTKRCYDAAEAQVLEEKSIGLPAVLNLDFVKTPEHDKDCIPGTKFVKQCSVCNCMEFKGAKVIDCQVDKCSENSVLGDVLSSYCIPGSYYEIDCLYCRCFKYRGIVWQRCVVNKACTISFDSPAATTTEPPLIFGSSNGVSVESNESNDITLDVIRLLDNKKNKCIPDVAYKLDCNYCICLSNGNSICTFSKCK